MDRRSIALILSFLGTLCFLAMAFKIVPTNYALFVGIACFIASGLVRNILRDR